MHRPPRLARALLAALLPSDERHAILRELDAEFAEHVRPERGARAGRAWYWRQVFGSVRPVIAMRRRRASGVLDRTARTRCSSRSSRRSQER